VKIKTQKLFSFQSKSGYDSSACEVFAERRYIDEDLDMEEEYEVWLSQQKSIWYSRFTVLDICNYLKPSWKYSLKTILIANTNRLRFWNWWLDQEDSLGPIFWFWICTFIINYALDTQKGPIWSVNEKKLLAPGIDA